MGSIVGEILPLAVGIAISPIPIIAAILMLLSPKAQGHQRRIPVGWLVGIIAAIVVFTLLSSVLPQPADGPSTVAGVIKIVLGALLLLLAVKQWRSRPAKGETAALPKWMAAIDSMTPGKALGLGFVLSAVNPKNLLMAASAGLVIGGAGLSVGEDVAVIAVFTVIAASTVLVPVIAYLAASAKMARAAGATGVWLVDNNATIMAVLLLVIGVSVIGKGIGSL